MKDTFPMRTMACPSHAPLRVRCSGFTLIELMIALALGLVILAALTVFFVQTSQNRSEMERNSRQIENGRYATDALREDLMLAGFYADLWQPQAVVTWNTPAACTTAIGSLGFFVSQLAPQLPVPIFGYAAGVGAPACVTQNKANTDVLVVRRFNSENIAPAAADASQFYVQISECATDNQLTPFAVQNGGSGSFSLHKVDCAALSSLWRYREQVYYVKTCSVCGTDTIPTLVRLELDGGTMKEVPLVEGIEDLRVDYGVDTNGDGRPDQWRRCDAGTPCSAADWANVTAAKVYVLSRNLETSPTYTDDKTYALGLSGTVGPFADGYKRHVYSSQVALMNRVGPREPKL